MILNVPTAVVPDNQRLVKVFVEGATWHNAKAMDKHTKDKGQELFRGLHYMRAAFAIAEASEHIKNESVAKKYPKLTTDGMSDIIRQYFAAREDPFGIDHHNEYREQDNLQSMCTSKYVYGGLSTTLGEYYSTGGAGEGGASMAAAAGAPEAGSKRQRTGGD